MRKIKPIGNKLLAKINFQDLQWPSHLMFKNLETWFKVNTHPFPKSFVYVKCEPLFFLYRPHLCEYFYYLALLLDLDKIPTISDKNDKLRCDYQFDKCLLVAFTSIKPFEHLCFLVKLLSLFFFIFHSTKHQWYPYMVL